MPSAEERFRAKVRRRGSHDLWTGFVDDRGVGMVRVNGKLRTVQRAAWELAHGPLPQGGRVNSCAAERACVRLAHLSIAPPPHESAPVPTAKTRRARGSGSVRELRAGVWQIAVTDRLTRARDYHTVYGDRHDAEAALAKVATTVRRDLGDLRVRELIDRYLHANHKPGSPAFARDRDVLRDVLEPAFGDDFAADLTELDIEPALTHVYRDRGSNVAHVALGLIRDAYRWARQQHWTEQDPTAGITLRALR